MHVCVWVWARHTLNSAHLWVKPLMLRNVARSVGVLRGVHENSAAALPGGAIMSISAPNDGGDSTRDAASSAETALLHHCVESGADTAAHTFQRRWGTLRVTTAWWNVEEDFKVCCSCTDRI